MISSKATIKRLPLQTCLLMNRSEYEPKFDALLVYLLEPATPNMVTFQSFESVLKKCQFQDVILITNNFEGLQEKLEAERLQSLLEKHRLYVLVLRKEALLTAFPPSPYVRYINSLNSDVIRSRLKKTVQKEMRLIKKKILITLLEASRNQLLESKKLKKSSFTSTFHFLIHSHYTNAQFTTADLAKKMQVSTSTLERKIVQLTDKTPKQYLLAYRLEKAKNELLFTYGKIGQVAKNNGFSSSTYFSTRFSLRYGTNPSQIRQKETTGSLG